jgi:catechol 2,3-dioxygenase-like lactoylglutathione lyase family enzyme
MIRVLALLLGLLLAAASAGAAPAVEGVDRIVIPVSRLDRMAAFYTGAFSFAPEGSGSSRGMVLRLGRETIELVPRAGGKIPTDSRSNDHWFQHLAIVVSKMSKAYAAARLAGALPISTGPQLLPLWNPNAGGIRAVYLHDPEGHPLELIQFPPGKGEPRWQRKDRLFLGIDHTGIVVGNTARSIAFYRDQLRLRIVGTSDNWGIEQERLSRVPGAHVQITSLRGAAGPGVELLQYLMPRDGRPIPADTTADDLWAEKIVFRVRQVARYSGIDHDPDGHAIGFVTDAKEVSR